MNLSLRCPGVYMGSISLKCLLKLHPEGNTEMVGAFGHKMGAQSGSFPPRIFRPTSPTFVSWDQDTKPRQGFLLDLAVSCKQSLRDLLGEKGRGYRDQDLAAWCWACSVLEPARLSMALHFTLNNFWIKWRCWQHLEVAKGKRRCSRILFWFGLTSVTISAFLSLALGHSSESLEVKELALLCFSAHGY